MKLYIIEFLSFNSPKKQDYPSMIDDIIGIFPLKANVPIEVITKKAKKMIKFEVEGVFLTSLSDFNEFNYFLHNALKIIIPFLVLILI